MFADFLDLAHPLMQTKAAALSAAQCAGYIDRFHADVAERAPVIGRDGEQIDLSLRNNTRVMWDSASEAAALLRTVKDLVPPTFKGAPLVGANERLRVYRYAPGERHSPHWDTEVALPGRLSRMTLVFYLNADFEGGQTSFSELDETVHPALGQALLFQHRVLHTAEPVRSGVKYALRTDLFYEANDLDSNPSSAFKKTDHDHS